MVAGDAQRARHAGEDRVAAGGAPCVAPVLDDARLAVHRSGGAAHLAARREGQGLVAEAHAEHGAVGLARQEGTHDAGVRRVPGAGREQHEVRVVLPDLGLQGVEADVRAQRAHLRAEARELVDEQEDEAVPVVEDEQARGRHRSTSRAEGASAGGASVAAASAAASSAARARAVRQARALWAVSASSEAGSLSQTMPAPARVT